ncbi:MAG: DUF4249 domain-containing protein [Paludibacter sp.]|nr:DUF4249 domain-containing protein [Paludibacter sp.]
MKKIKFPLIAIILALFSSCEKEIEFNGEVTEPLIVVNSFLTPDSAITVELTKSLFFLDSKNDFDRVDNATVSIEVNGQLKETLRFMNHGKYTGDYKALPGDSVALLVKVPGHEDVRSSVVVQQASVILSVDTLSKKLIERYESQKIDNQVIAWMTHYEKEIGVRIKDAANVKNFYRLSVFYREQYAEHPEGYLSGYYMFFNLQGVSNEATSGSILGLVEGESSDEFHVFTDELFDGKEIVLRFKIYDYVFEVEPGFEHLFDKQYLTMKRSYIVNLQSIPQDTYLYLKSKDAAEQVFETFFTEPVQIYTNIENGVGIFGAITNNRRTIDVNK